MGAVFGVVFLLGFLFWAGKQKLEEVPYSSRQLFAMDTVMSFTAFGERSQEAIDAAVEEVNRLDALLSTEQTSSEIFKLNEKGKGSVSEDTLKILRKAGELYKETEGLFDCTIYPLMKLWGFAGKEYQVPDALQLKQTVRLVDASQIQFDGNEVILGEGQMLDLGGIAKGYASARVMEIYRQYGIVSGMVSLGGNVETLGCKPDGSSWKIGIRNPQGQEEEILGVIPVENKAVVTSGGYERYFEENGKTYIHILNPHTGYPVEGDLLSVTIVSEDGMLADALSTSLYLMGKEKAADYWRAHKKDFEVILVTEKMEVYVSEGICETYTMPEKFQVIQ